MITQEPPGRRPALVDVRTAVRRFLQESAPDIFRVDVTKVTAVAAGEPAWEAEAVVWQPNATIQALGLSTRRPVLDQVFYVVRLDSRLDVIGYEVKEVENAP